MITTSNLKLHEYNIDSMIVILATGLHGRRRPSPRTVQELVRIKFYFGPPHSASDAIKIAIISPNRPKTDPKISMIRT